MSWPCAPSRWVSRSSTPHHAAYSSGVSAPDCSILAIAATRVVSSPCSHGDATNDDDICLPSTFLDLTTSQALRVSRDHLAPLVQIADSLHWQFSLRTLFAQAVSRGRAREAREEWLPRASLMPVWRGHPPELD